MGKNNRSNIIIDGVIILITVALSALLYITKYSKDAIFKHVINQKGYSVYEIQKPIYLKASIKPDWLPKVEGEISTLNIEIGQAGKVKIMIESIIHRGNDIYFNFDTIPYIQYKEGEFLLNDIINGDGTFTSFNLHDAFRIYNKDNEEIEVGQRGFGPGCKFSFGISIDNYEQIAKGFKLEYTGSVLYGYRLTKYY